MVRPAYAAVEPRVACNPLVPAAGRYERIAKGGRAVTKGMFSRVSQRLNRRASRTLVLNATVKMKIKTGHCLPQYAIVLA